MAGADRRADKEQERSLNPAYHGRDEVEECLWPEKASAGTVVDGVGFYAG